MRRLNELKKDLAMAADPEKAVILRRFFKTNKGEYGYGDKFLGIVVPAQRRIARNYLDLPLADIERLLHSPYHEERLTALLMLTYLYPKAAPAQQAAIYKLYLANLAYINNWDLVDLSAPNIVGAHLLKRPRAILYRLARNKHLWTRRVAMLATFEFLKNGQADDTIALAEILLRDEHDLIQKAVGWMLREMGKRCGQKRLTDFLDQYAREMPRMMLRYSIERLPENQRLKYLKLS